VTGFEYRSCLGKSQKKGLQYNLGFDIVLS
jgi:hypothetical protein